METLWRLTTRLRVRPSDLELFSRMVIHSWNLKESGRKYPWHPYRLFFVLNAPLLPFTKKARPRTSIVDKWGFLDGSSRDASYESKVDLLVSSNGFSAHGEFLTENLKILPLVRLFDLANSEQRDAHHSHLAHVHLRESEQVWRTNIKTMVWGRSVLSEHT